MRYRFVFLIAFFFFPLTSHATIPLTNNTEAECTSEGGRCSANDARCARLNASTSDRYDPIGYCDGATGSTACCKAGAATGGTGPGTDYYCVNTHKGRCAQESAGCPSGASKLDACSTDASGARKICCSIPPTSTPTVGAMNYTLLEEIPGSDGRAGQLNVYLQSLYRFTFWAIGIAALFMLTVGGFMYVTSAGNTSRIGTAKTIIVDSLLGIIIALFAWLFLYVLNPDLVEGLSLPTSNPTAPGSGGGPTPPTTTGLLTHAEAVAALGSGITLSSSGGCSDPANSKCTSLEGIPASVVESIKNLRTKSGCSLIITGGTETGHKTHGPGRGAVDFAEDTCLGNFLQANVLKHGELRIQRICATSTWFSKVGATCTESAAAPHFHIQFAL